MPDSTQACKKWRNVLASALLALSMGSMACNEEQKKEKSDRARLELVPVDLNTLKFESTEVKARFFALHDAAKRVGQKDFEHRPLARTKKPTNNAIAEWAKGINAGAPGPRLQGPIHLLEPIQWIHVAAVFVPPEDPLVKGLWLHIQYIASKPDQWCSYLEYAQGSNRSQWSVHFFKWDESKYGFQPFRPDTYVKLEFKAPCTRYFFCETEVNLDSKRSVSDSFVRYAKSADALREAALADLATLEAQVIKVIREHKAEKRVYERPEGGKSYRFHLEKLNTEDEAAQIVLAKQYFASQAEIIRAHHREMYATLRNSFPLDQSWSEIGGKKPDNPK